MMFFLLALLTIVLLLAGSWEMSLPHNLNQSSSAVGCSISRVWTPMADSILQGIGVQRWHCPPFQQGSAATSADEVLHWEGWDQ